MPTITLTVPNALVTELNAIAVDAGFSNARAMVIAYLRATIRASRSQKAIIGLREAAETQADQETGGIV